MLTSAASLSFPSYSPSHLPPLKFTIIKSNLVQTTLIFRCEKETMKRDDLLCCFRWSPLEKERVKLKGDRWCLIREV